MTNLKNTLYKYLTTNYLYETIRDSKIYLNDGTIINDPFELKYILRESGTVKTIKGLHILCLTKSHRMKLMWSHYTDSHKGVCLALEIPRHLVYPICYTGERVFSDSNLDDIIARAYKGKEKSLFKSYDLLSSNQKIALIKDSKWNYEKEYRIVFDNEEGLIYDNNKWFMSVKIKRLYLGVNFDTEKNKDIIQLCKKKE